MAYLKSIEKTAGYFDFQLKKLILQAIKNNVKPGIAGRC